MTDLAFASIRELAALMRNRELSAVELMHHTLDRVASLNGRCNALVSLDPDRALSEAATAARQITRGVDLGPLAGIPVAVKDLEDARGFATSRGTKAFRDLPAATTDSIHVARLRAAGAIVIGKTNTPPMGAAIHTDNEAFGATRNPWNLEKSPGGSSGGSAAAVAAGIVPLATAGDGGGSTRIPAALCGIIGLKPTRGCIPEGPSRIPTWTHHSCPTPMARTVHDTALQLDIAAGFHPADPFSLPRPNRPYLEAVDRPPRSLRIGVNRTLGVANPEPAILDALDTAVDTLRHLGHHTIDDHTPHPCAETFPEVIALRQQVLACNRFMSVAEEFTAHRGHFEPWFAAHLDHGRSVTTTDLARYWTYRGQLDRWAAELFERHDLLLTPTTPTTAWPAEGPDICAAAQQRTIPIAYTAAFNDTGNPAISIPINTSPEGLPCAIQLVAPHHHDGRLLAIAAAIERTIGHLQPPRQRA